MPKTKRDKCRVSGCLSNSLTPAPVPLHKIPNHHITRNAWIKILGICPARENLNMLKVCARHFDDEDYFRDKSGKHCIPRNLAIPKRFLPEESSKRIATVEQEMYQEVFSTDSDDEKFQITNSIIGEQSSAKEIEKSTPGEAEIVIKDEPKSSCQEYLEFSDRYCSQKKLMVDGSMQTDPVPKFQAIITFERLQARQMMYFTEFSHDQFNALFNFLIKSKSVTSDLLHAFTLISPVDQLLLTLYKYRLNQDFKMIGALFNVTPFMACKIFKHWSELINLCLNDIDFWSLGKTDGNKYRLCLHCVRVPLGSNLSSVKSEFPMKSTSNMKFKCLIGINEGGIVIFCSKLFKHDISSQQMVLSSNLLDGLSSGDTILTSSNFEISDLLKRRNVAVNINPFILDFDSALTKTSFENKNLANRKIHTDRLANLVNTYKILADPFENDLLPMFSSIIYNCAMLCNFRPKKK